MPLLLQNVLKKTKNKTLKYTEDISILVELERKHEYKVVGTVEQYIPGERLFYEVLFQCRRCKNHFDKTFTKDRKLV